MRKSKQYWYPVIKYTAHQEIFLTLQNTMVTAYTNYFNIKKFRILPTDYIYSFLWFLEVSRD